MSERSPDDRVGYGRPPLHTRFRKGRSGNPKGRPKGSRSLANVWSDVWNEKLTVTENGQRHRITKQEAAIKQFANKAASGDKRLIEAMIKYHTIISSDAPMRRSEPPDRKHPPPETDRRKIALALLSILRRADPEESSSSS